MREQCQELKEIANTSVHDKKLLSTRLKALDRELQRRERLLRTMSQLQRAGQGLGMDLIEKLREERNMLPIYRKKLQDLHAQMDEKEEEIRTLKQDPRFTRVIELQVEYASWQHEGLRLDSLLKELSSGHAGEEMRLDAGAHARRLSALREKLREEEKKREALDDDMKEVKEYHEYALNERKQRQESLAVEQKTTRDVALHFKHLLQERREVEQIEDEVAALKIDEQRLQEELQEAATDLEAAGAVAPPSGRSCESVSQDVLRGPAKTPPLLLGCLGAMRRALAGVASVASGGQPLFVQLRQADAQLLGAVSVDQLEAVLQVAAGGCAAAQESVPALARMIPAEEPQEASGRGSAPVRWLDWLAAFDRLQGNDAEAEPALPAPRRLRAATLRSKCSSEDLRARLLGARSREDVEVAFCQLGLRAEEAVAWADAWRVLGSTGLLARLPMGEVALPRPALEAWLARCSAAVKKESQDLQESFRDFPANRLTEEQFCAVCREVLAAELSSSDVDDLALFVAADGVVDGATVLRLFNPL